MRFAAEETQRLEMQEELAGARDRSLELENKLREVRAALAEERLAAESARAGHAQLRKQASIGGFLGRESFLLR